MPRSAAPVKEWDLVNRFQVFLLALTGLVLSLASGWTTWIGMTNFTHESVLSLMITFGIQGVMLALSWVLGSRLASTLAVGHAAEAHGQRLAAAHAVGQYAKGQRRGRCYYEAESHYQADSRQVDAKILHEPGYCVTEK